MQSCFANYCTTFAKVLSAFPKLGSWPLPFHSCLGIPAFSIWRKQHGPNKIGCRLSRWGAGACAVQGRATSRCSPRPASAGLLPARISCVGSTLLVGGESSEFWCHELARTFPGFWIQEKDRCWFLFAAILRI